ncbi:hypothetical protein Tco_1020383 [Tanacetum coccineum]|uniref:Retrotransposon gag domain-containing protein n=1 Tax=Tanacetum coccineum TaxID=301880 RepID=A0ABQ5G1C7_9ASTR
MGNGSGTMGVPHKDFAWALMSMTEREARGREAAIGMTWNDFKALLVEEFCPSNEMKRLENEFWNRKMSNEKRKAVEETSKSGGSWKENKKAKVGTGFVATAALRNEFVGSNPRKISGLEATVHPSMENQVRGRAFNVNVNAMEAVRDLNVVTGYILLAEHWGHSRRVDINKTQGLNIR